jgi:hypothetical protein
MDVQTSNQEVAYFYLNSKPPLTGIYRLHDIETSYTSLTAFVKNLISTRKQETATDFGERKGQDVFSRMIRASER